MSEDQGRQKGEVRRFRFEVLKMKMRSERFFKDAVVDGISSSIDGLMISDERSSIVIGTIGREKLAIIIKLPAIAMMQKTVWESLV
jgi:hypothetical protein